jgi:hypothetical protein
LYRHIACMTGDNTVTRNVAHVQEYAAGRPTGAADHEQRNKTNQSQDSRFHRCKHCVN